jgi:hypothetical protein
VKRHWWILIGVNIAVITAIAVTTTGLFSQPQPPLTLVLGGMALVILDVSYLIVWRIKTNETRNRKDNHGPFI